MKNFTVLYLTLVMFTLLSYTAVAQEQGELLFFNDAPNLKLELTGNMLQSITDLAVYQSPQSNIIEKSVDRLLFNGIVSDSNMMIQVSFQLENGEWSIWQNTFLRIFKNGRFWARFDLDSIVAQRVKYRVVDLGLKFPFQFEIYAVEGVKIEKDTQKEKESLKSSAKVQYVMTDTIPKPPVISRQEWGANPPIGSYVPHNPYRLTQHHTAGPRVSTLQEGIEEMQFIQDFHQYGRGWQDIGYHFLVDDNGRLYEGVPTDFRGTHVGGNNTGNVGISYMGNFHITGEFPTLQALESLTDMWSWLCYHYGIDPSALLGHRDYNATACPGDNLYVELPNLRNEIRQKLAFDAPYLLSIFPRPFTEEVPRDISIQLSIREEEEGVDINSIVMKINGEVVAPSISGNPSQYDVSYTPAEPFPYAQTVYVDIEAADLANPANVLQYSYQFKIEIEALYVEVQSPSTMRNANLQIEGDWEVDNDDVDLTGLISGPNLRAVDNDSSHLARIYPSVPEEGDYLAFIAVSDNFLGEMAHYRFINEIGYVHPQFIEYNDRFNWQWGQLSPTPIHFAPDTSSNGYIELSGISDLDTRLILDAFRFEKVDRLDPPYPPTLKWVKRINPPGNQVEICWYPNLEGDIAGYRLYMSEDGLNWDHPLVDEQTLDTATHSYQLTYNGTSHTIYFQVVAVDTNKFVGELGEEEPLLSVPSDAYGVGLYDFSTKILIVDNFDRMASWQKPYHPFVRSHGEAVSSHGFGFESCTETAVQNGEIDLNGYDVVVYFCGDDSRADESLAAADQFRLLEYLKNGGKLFISGSEIGYDFDATTTIELQRYQNLLKAQYIGDLSGSNRVLGEAGTVFDGLDFVYGTMSGPDLYIEDYPDYLHTFGGSESALFYSNLRIAGIQYTGKYENSSEVAQLVYLGFTFETIVTPEDRAELMGRVLAYFGLVSDIADQRKNVPVKFELVQNYPNPFNPSTTIKYSIPANQHNEAVTLEIFNALGQKVKTLINEKRKAGFYSTVWRGNDDIGNPVASGIYFYRLSAGKLVKTRKMILIR